MLIVLGFAIATFMALIVGRLAWKLAVRVGARRVQRNVPVTVVDLQNDRDRLRAEQAILARKIEVRLDEMKLRMAEQSAEVTRNRNRVETLMQQITDRELTIAERDAEVASLSSKIRQPAEGTGQHQVIVGNIAARAPGQGCRSRRLA